MEELAIRPDPKIIYFVIPLLPPNTPFCHPQIKSLDSNLVKRFSLESTTTPKQIEDFIKKELIPYGTYGVHTFTFLLLTFLQGTIKRVFKNELQISKNLPGLCASFSSLRGTEFVPLFLQVCTCSNFF